jgi:hypothetical protein
MLDGGMLHLCIVGNLAVAVVVNREDFLAVDLHEEIVFGVHVERRGRIRRRHEQEAFDLREARILDALEAACAPPPMSARLRATGDIRVISRRA